MKNKKIYIGISIIAIILICTVASIFLIKYNIKQANFSKNEIDENTKEAMSITEEEDMAMRITNAENEEEQDESTETSEEEASNVEEEQSDTQEETNTEEQEEAETTTDTTTESEVKETSTEQTKQEFTVKAMSATMYVSATSLNVRSGPATTYSKIGSLKYSAEVTITGKVNEVNWYKIKYNSKEGYVDATYLTTTKPVQETTVETTESTTQAGSSTVANLIIINSKNNTLRYYINGSLTRSYSCATGKSSSATPTGKFSVYNKIVNRPYYKENIAGGAANNPLGKRWLGLDCYGTKGTTYAIHGTNNESSIGKNVSHGCVRMHNADIESLYDIVPVGTTVIIQSSSKTDKQIAAQYGINIE